MRSRERLLAAITGQPIDRVPWSPFLAYYWDNLPAETRKMGQFAYMRQMGADPLLRGFHHLVKYTYINCEIREQIRGKEKLVTFDTPVGQLTERYVYSPAGNTWFLADHPVKTAEDFRILQYIHEHMTMEPDFALFLEDRKLCGEDALILPTIGVASKTAFQSLVEHWVGTEQLAYSLADESEIVEECLAVMQEKDEENVKLSIQSGADGYIFWEDSSTTNISPSMFEAYTAPEINRWGDLVHGQGGLLIHHACGLLNKLLPAMAKTNIDAIESITPPPTGNISLQDAAALLPEHIALIGGLDPVRLLKGSPEEVCEDARALLRDLKGRRFVLANADSCPPDVEYEKFVALSELVKE